MQSVLLKAGFLQSGITGNPARYNDRFGSDLFGGSGCATEQFFNDGVLETRNQVQSFLRSGRQELIQRRPFECATPGDFGRNVVGLCPAQNCGFQSAKAEVQLVALHAGQREFYGARIAVWSEFVDYRPARIAEAEQFRNLVVRLPSRVVACFAQQTIGPRLAHFKQVRVAAAYDQSESREADFGVFEQHRVNVPFHVIDGDERQFSGEAQSLGIRDTYQQRADQPGTLRNGDCTKVFQTDLGFGKRLVDYGHDGSQMLSRSQFRDYPAVACMSVQLRSDDA